jgi:hypothetical protein
LTPDDHLIGQVISKRRLEPCAQCHHEGCVVNIDPSSVPHPDSH